MRKNQFFAVEDRRRPRLYGRRLRPLPMRKKGQFFIISIVLLVLSLVVLFATFTTIGEMSSRTFAHSSYDEFSNIINTIEKSNDELDANWWNTSYTKRRMFKTPGSVSNPAEFDVSLVAGKLTNCQKEVRVTDTSHSEITNIEVTSDIPPCDLIMLSASTNTDYYVYYNSTTSTVLKDIGAGTSATPTLYDEISLNLCEHLEDIYPRRGIYLTCSDNSDGDRITYTIDYKSNTFEFSGDID